VTEKVIVRSYRDLVVWQKGIALVKSIYMLSAKFPHSEVYALSSQLRRAAISVPSNIAEGHARQHTGEYRQFLYVALGSLAEVETQTCIAKELNYLSAEEYDTLLKQIVEIQKILNTIITRLSKN
jgi:four helix bundle protein